MTTQPRELPLEEFPDLLRPHTRVYVAGGAGEPTALLNTLKGTPSASAGVHFLQFPLPGLNRVDFTALNPSARQTVFFMTPALRNADPVRTDFLPMHLRRICDYLLADPPDVALLQVAKDRTGRLRIAANVDFAEAAIHNPATELIAMLNDGFVAPLGAPEIAPSRINYLITGASQVPEFPAADIDAVARQIGVEVAGLISDGDCLQTGIGAIPAAVLAALQGKRDLGLHGGLFDEGMLALLDAGVVTGERKNRDTG